MFNQRFWGQPFDWKAITKLPDSQVMKITNILCFISTFYNESTQGEESIDNYVLINNASVNLEDDTMRGVVHRLSHSVSPHHHLSVLGERSACFGMRFIFFR